MLHSMPKGQLEQLQQHLIVPLAVGDIIRHDLAVEPDMQYGLHLALSEIDPDSALLAIAFCAIEIANVTLKEIPIANALKKEAEDIIIDYGPVWLEFFNSEPMPTKVFEKILQTVPEDLEALADLMDAVCAEMTAAQENIFSLANLMSIQARAHMEIADYILLEIQQEISISGDDKAFMSKPAPLRDYAGDNIILFPGKRR